MKFGVAFVLLLALVGCSVRPAETPAGKTATPPAGSKETVKAESTGTGIEEIDKSKVALAEVRTPITQLGAKLRILAQYDPHMDWNDAFIKETVTEASWLKEGEKLEGEMVAKHKDKTLQVQVVMIRVSEKEIVLRVLSSDSAFADELSKKFK
ncbi:MAG: hypothetical protein LCH41_13750 [Armatimonadetes bacterium]|nr:hypothetical protein [Armatimonadota bacterium]